MIFRDIIVDMPLKKRVTKYGSHKKPYVYEILKRQGKDCEKDTVVCVGLAIDDKKMNPNEKYVNNGARAPLARSFSTTSTEK